MTLMIFKKKNANVFVLLWSIFDYKRQNIHSKPLYFAHRYIMLQLYKSRNRKQLAGDWRDSSGHFQPPAFIHVKLKKNNCLLCKHGSGAVQFENPWLTPPVLWRAGDGGNQPVFVVRTVVITYCSLRITIIYDVQYNIDNNILYMARLPSESHISLTKCFCVG